MNSCFSKSFFISFLFIFTIIEETLSIQLITNCTSQGNKYYDTFIYECVECYQNSDSTGSGCKCKRGFYSYFNPNTKVYSCEPCPQGTASSLDRSTCIACPNGVDPATLDCFCPSGSELIETDSAGQYLTTKKCNLCPSNTFPGPPLPVYGCKACQTGAIYDTTQTLGWQCVCNTSQYTTAGNICIPTSEVNVINSQYSPNGASTITFNDGVNADGMPNIFTINSDTINYFYLQSAYRCSSLQNSTSCQVLSNLCVIKLYDQSTQICTLYKNLYSAATKAQIGGDTNYRNGIPYLFYSSPSILSDTTRIKFQVSFDPKVLNNTGFVNSLQLFISKYDIYGNYYGIEPLTTQFMLCNANYDDGNMFRSFGTTIENSCNIDLRQFLPRKYTMFFYELFLLDPVQGKLIDIPILITNILTANEGKPNESKDQSKYVLTRRFFLVDNLSGIEGPNNFYKNTTITTVIRYAKIISFNVQLNPNDSARITTPFLKITYQSRNVDSLNISPSGIFFFQSMYYMDLTNFYSKVQALFITLNVIVLVVISVKMYIWTKNNPSELSPDNYILWFIWNLMIKLFQTWSIYIFWFLFSITAYWYVFFKLQYTVYILLPMTNTWWDNYRPFDIAWGIAASAYTLYILYKIYDQTNYDIFFIDWEHQKEILIKNSNELLPKSYRGCWRSFFIANEFNELQNGRTIEPFLCFTILLFFWYTLDWISLQSYVPNLNRQNNSPLNRILGYFITTFILLMCGFCHIVLRKILENILIPHPKTDFIDLLSVANMSVFILDQSLHGYYIHGQSPSGKADMNVDELLKTLEEEGQGKVRNRGLVEENLQTYEIYLSYNMRIMYDGFFANQTESMILTAQTRDKMSNQSRLGNPLRALPKTLPVDKIYKLKNYINSQLKEKIQKVSNSPSQFIKNKTQIQRFLDYPPMEFIGNTAFDIVLFKDPNMNFDSILFYGIEWEWFIWNIFVFQFWQTILGWITMSCMFTIIIDKFFLWIRSVLAEKNLARKSIIDNKFLL